MYRRRPPSLCSPGGDVMQIKQTVCDFHLSRQIIRACWPNCQRTNWTFVPRLVHVDEKGMKPLKTAWTFPYFGDKTTLETTQFGSLLENSPKSKQSLRDLCKCLVQLANFTEQGPQKNRGRGRTSLWLILTNQKKMSNGSIQSTV